MGDGLPPDLDPNDDYDPCYGVEDGYIPPSKRSATMEQVEMEPTSAIESADTEEGEVVSSELNQGSAGSLSAQVPGLSATSDSSQLVQAEATVTDGIQMIPTPSITVTNYEEEALKNAFPRGTNAYDAGAHLWQGRSGTAEEIVASWKVECRERAAPTAPTDGREPKKSAEPLSLAVTPHTAHQPPALTQAAVSGSEANHGTIFTIPLVISGIVSHMLDTARTTIRNSDGHSPMIEVEATEMGMRDVTGAMETLDIDGRTPPAVMLRSGETQGIMATAVRTQEQNQESEIAVPNELQATTSGVQSRMAPQVNNTATSSTRSPASPTVASTGRGWGQSKLEMPRDAHGQLLPWLLLWRVPTKW